MASRIDSSFSALIPSQDPQNIAPNEITTIALDTLQIQENLDHTAAFPDEIWTMIFSFFSAQELITSMQVCKHWQTIGNTEMLWHALCLKKGWMHTSLKGYECYRYNFSKAIFISKIPYKTETVHSSLNHDVLIYATTGLNSDIVVFANLNAEILVWDFNQQTSIYNEMNQRNYNFYNHIGWLDIQQNKLVFVHADRTSQKKWIMKEGSIVEDKILWELPKEITIPIQNFCFYENTLAILQDKFITIYDKSTLTPLFTLPHSSSVTAMIFNESVLITSTKEGKFYFWDTTTGKCIDTLQAPEKIGSDHLFIHGTTLISTYSTLCFQYLITWDIDLKKQHPILEFNLYDKVFILNEHIFAISTLAQEIYLRDTSTGKILNKLNGFQGSSNSHNFIHLREEKLFVFGSNGKISIFDFKNTNKESTNSDRTLSLMQQSQQLRLARENQNFHSKV